MSSSIRDQMFASLGAKYLEKDTIDFELVKIFSKLSVEARVSGGKKKKKENLEEDRALLSPTPTPTEQENKIDLENKIKSGLGKIIRNERQPKVLKRSFLETVCE